MKMISTIAAVFAVALMSGSAGAQSAKDDLAKIQMRNKSELAEHSDTMARKLESLIRADARLRCQALDKYDARTCQRLSGMDRSNGVKLGIQKY